MARLHGNYGPVAQSWKSIRDYYFTLPLPLFKPHQDFIEALMRSPYPEAGLQGLTSMHDLLLGMNPSVMDEPLLRIRYDHEKGVFGFAYPGGDLMDPFRDATWVRHVAPDKAFQTLERFLVKHARWFRDHRDPKK